MRYNTHNIKKINKISSLPDNNINLDSFINDITIGADIDAIDYDLDLSLYMIDDNDTLINSDEYKVHLQCDGDYGFEQSIKVMLKDVPLSVTKIIIKAEFFIERKFTHVFFDRSIASVCIIDNNTNDELVMLNVSNDELAILNVSSASGVAGGVICELLRLDDNWVFKHNYKKKLDNN